MFRSCCFALVGTALLVPQRVVAQRRPAPQVKAKDVLRAIDRGSRYLMTRQNDDGSWSVSGRAHKVGVTSLATMALLNAGIKNDHASIRKALGFLRKVKEPDPKLTYEISLMIMALAAADDGARDKRRIIELAARLEGMQISKGPDAGSWTYMRGGPFPDGGDRSNAQFAVLALRDAAHAGVKIKRRTWELVNHHWRSQRNRDGGWGYARRLHHDSRGSMTVAGIATLVICNEMLRDPEKLDGNGKPLCCQKPEKDEVLENAIEWLAAKYTVGSNPGGGGWVLYYMYGLERAGRLSARRFFGDHDWYRDGAHYLIEHGQNKRLGSFIGFGGLETEPVIGTSFALLFLSKGLAPVLINKLKYGPPDGFRRGAIKGNNWNKHPHDVRRLVEHVTTLKKWPKLLTWQTLEMEKVLRFGGVEHLLQAPILYISGQDEPATLLEDKPAELLKGFLEQGGWIVAVNNCNGAGFEDGLKKLVRKMYPDPDVQLKPLDPGHPIYRSEYKLDPKTVKLWGVNVGCRTAVIYIPEDASCLWDKWTQHPPEGRDPRLTAHIDRANRIGVNVIAYCTGREPPNKLKAGDVQNQAGANDRIQRGLLQVAKLRHDGSWDAAPRALRNLLMSLNRTMGSTSVSTKQRNLLASDPNVFKYPVLYMHGRNSFELSRASIDNIRKHLKDRGGVLFADSCCGARKFDRGFRDLVAQLFPDKQLKRIPVTHELFSTKIGYDIKKVRRRAPETDNKNVAIRTVERVVEPYLEGIEIDGRYVVIYSKYDISCALERQASAACAGYVEADAMKIAVNVIVYAMLQDVRYADWVQK